MTTPLEQINNLLKNIKDNFSELVDIIYQCEYQGEDALALIIVDSISALPLNERLDLLICDLHSREDKLESEMVFYPGLWYSIAESPDSRINLIKELSHGPEESGVFEFLCRLDEGDNTPGEKGVRETLKAIGITMPLPDRPEGKVTRKKLAQLRNDVRGNFSGLIDAIIYYDNTGPCGPAWSAVHDIENLPVEEEIFLLITDLDARSKNPPKSLMYSSLWIETACEEIFPIEVLRHTHLLKNKEQVMSYLATLVDNDDSDSDANILEVLNTASDISNGVQPGK